MKLIKLAPNDYFDFDTATKYTNIISPSGYHIYLSSSAGTQEMSISHDEAVTLWSVIEELYNDAAARI